ncbi:endonuclease/exonuclease/phosphatase family protein [Streptomyces sp. Qhu_M48]|uniref:endonuclease/exonuclease/phosphatase family protein n=1 Tax=Streptomyces sp. Qhu_M48 TaxID=3435889 RepID=UPI003F4FF556
MDRVLAAEPAAEPVKSPAPTPPEPPLRPRHRVTAWAAGLLLLGPALLTACRLLGTDAVTPVPQLLSLLPWCAVPAALGLLLAAVARRRALGAVAAVVLAATLWTALPYGPDSTGAHGPVVARLRVLASNVEFGEATGALVTTIRRERPQLVFVSECDRACGRTLTTAFADELPHYASVEADGSAGSVILSAYPLRDWRMLPSAMGMPGATAEIGGRSVRLQLAHPLPPLPGQVHLWKRELGLVEDAAAHEGPLLIAGDFNASQDHAAFRSVLDAGDLHDAARLTGASRTPTWPMEGPVPPYVQIDHVLVSEDFTAGNTRFPDLPGTDHRAVVTDLDLHTGR